jgi:hypothetical protein
MFDIDDTDWRMSAKGNQWRQVRGTLLVVGRNRKGTGYWAMVGTKFLPRTFETQTAAEEAAETVAENLPRRSIFAREIDEL